MKKSLPIALLPFAVLLASCASEPGPDPSTPQPVDPQVQQSAFIPENEKAAASDEFKKIPQEYRDKIPGGAPAPPGR